MVTKLEEWLDENMVGIVLVMIVFSLFFLFWQFSTQPSITELCAKVCSKTTGYTYNDNQTVFYTCLDGCEGGREE